MNTIGPGTTRIERFTAPTSLSPAPGREAQPEPSGHFIPGDGTLNHGIMPDCENESLIPRPSVGYGSTVYVGSGTKLYASGMAAFSPVNTGAAVPQPVVRIIISLASDPRDIHDRSPAPHVEPRVPLSFADRISLTSGKKQVAEAYYQVGRELAKRVTGEGLSVKEIAEHLSLPVHNVKHCFAEIFGALKARDRAQALFKAIKAGLLKVDEH